jgi:protease II
MDFLPGQDEVLSYVDANHASGIVAGENLLYVAYRKVGDMGFYKIDYQTKQVTKVQLAGKGSIEGLSRIGANDLVFGQYSALKSMQFMRYEAEHNKIDPLPFSKLSLDLTPDFVTEVIEVPSRDGKKIPVSLVYKKDLALKNKNPLYIEAYGSGGAVGDLLLKCKRKFSHNIIPGQPHYTTIFTHAFKLNRKVFNFFFTLSSFRFYA